MQIEATRKRTPINTAGGLNKCPWYCTWPVWRYNWVYRSMAIHTNNIWARLERQKCGTSSYISWIPGAVLTKQLSHHNTNKFHNTILTLVPLLSHSCFTLVPILSHSCPIIISLLYKYYLTLVPLLSQYYLTLVPILSHSCPNINSLLSHSCPNIISLFS